MRQSVVYGFWLVGDDNTITENGFKRSGQYDIFTSGQAHGNVLASNTYKTSNF